MTHKATERKPLITTYPSTKKGFNLKITLTDKMPKGIGRFFGFDPYDAEDLRANNVYIIERIEEVCNGIRKITESTPEYPIFLLAHLDEDFGYAESAFLYEPFSRGPRLRPVGQMAYTDNDPNTLYWCIG